MTDLPYLYQIADAVLDVVQTRRDDDYTSPKGYWVTVLTPQTSLAGRYMLYLVNQVELSSIRAQLLKEAS